MHRALLVDDVVCAIVASLLSGQRPCEGALAALARTCRALSGPALDALWATASLWDLAMTMSEDCRAITTTRYTTSVGAGPSRSMVREDVRVLTLTTRARVLSAHELGPRFVQSARRMRRVCVGDTMQIGGPASCRCQLGACVLARWAAEPELFTGVIHLSLRKHSSGWAEHAAFLATVARPGHLSDLSIEIAAKQKTDPAAPVLDVLLAAAPGLRALQTTSFHRPVEAPSAWMTTLLARTTHLQKLSAEHVVFDLDALRRATQNGSLRQLVMVTPLVGVPETLKMPEGALCSLYQFHLRDSTPAAMVTRVLLAYCGSALTSCTLYLSGDLACADINAVMRAVLRLSSIRELRLKINGSNVQVPTMHQTAAILRTLCSLPLLETASLSTPLNSLVDAALVTSVADACPRLKTLHLCASWRQVGQQASVTLLAFLAMLHAHPQLEALPVVLSISVLPGADMCAAFGTHQYSTMLTLEDAEEKQVVAFVGLVSTLLPRLSAIEVLGARTRHIHREEDSTWRL